MNMNQIQNILKLDENNEKMRQKQLYEHDLQYDPNRPIYQHPLNLANYIDGNNEEVFSEMVRNLIHTMPLQQPLQQLQKYDQTQRQIENLEQGYINQLEEQEVEKTLQDLKDLIEQKNIEIQAITQNNYHQAQQNIITQKEISEYNDFVQENTHYLENVNANEEKFAKQEQNFNQLRDTLKNKRQQVEQEFNRQYKTVLFQKERLKILQNEGKSKRMEVEELSNELSAIHSLGLKLEDEVDSIQIKLNEQKALAQHSEQNRKSNNEQQGSKISNVDQASSEVGMSLTNSQVRQTASSRARAASSVRHVTHVKKEGSNLCFFMILLLATVVLSLVTVLKFF